jgi:hypothetical protein
MTQRDLDRAVAHATGEYISEIRRRGFSVLDSCADELDPDPRDAAPQIVDWDELDQLRQAPFFSPHVSHERQAA